MKRCYLFTIVFVLITVIFTGCSLWTDGAYHTVEDHAQEDYLPNQNNREIGSFNELEQALDYMVVHGVSSDLLYVHDMNAQQLESSMAVAVQNIKRYHAIGAYAVNEIIYEIGNNTGRMAISIEITYHHTRGDILMIQDAANMTETSLLIAQALNGCEAEIVVLVKNYEDTDFIQLVEDYANDNPHSCMETPQVSVGIYPERGIERVVELTFTYQTSRNNLRDFQKKVQAVFDSARLYVSEDAGDWEKSTQLYAFLMERFDYTIETSITPSYSLLHHGVGDSRAFANVYAAICRQAGLDCDVVSGTRQGKALYWNVLKIDGVYYYVDLLYCNEHGKFIARQQHEMSGYVWDYSQT